MKNYIGSVVKRSNYFHWRYRDVDGKSTSKVIKNSNGVKVTDLAEAEMRQAFTTEQLQTIWETLQSPDYHGYQNQSCQITADIGRNTVARYSL